MPKPLFGDNAGEVTNEQGYKLINELEDILKPLIDRYAAEGYAMRQFEYIVNMVVGVECSHAILKRGAAERKALRESMIDRARELGSWTRS